MFRRIIFALLICLMACQPGKLQSRVLAATDQRTLVLAGSDYQNSTKSKNKKDNLTNIVKAIKKQGYTNPAGVIFAGDYTDINFTTPASTSNAQIRQLLDIVENVFPNLSDQKFILSEGNHETAKGIKYSTSGAHDSKEYGVFVINEDDYMWHSSTDKSELSADREAISKKTANNLKNYLNEKIKKRYKKPIFIPCHVPLHFTSRTAKLGDGTYGSYLFNVLNKAGAAGLNIIVLYGHNHSTGAEDFWGGSAVFLKPGDSMNIVDLSKKKGKIPGEKDYESRKLNFFYMNAGYVGFYDKVADCDATLNMTTFLIDKVSVEFARVDKNGLHNLKSAGMAANNLPACKANKKIYRSKSRYFLTEVDPEMVIDNYYANYDLDGKQGKKTDLTKTDFVCASGHGKTVLYNVKKATYTTKGYSGDLYCTVCNACVKWGKTTPVLVDPLVKDKPDLKSVEAEILQSATDSGPSKQKFTPLCARSYEVSNTTNTIRWSKMNLATGYVIYGSQCGRVYKKLKTVNTGGEVSWTRKGLSAGKSYKYIVVAVRNAKVLAVSKVLHVRTSGGKYTNYIVLTPKVNQITVRVGSTFSVKVDTKKKGTKPVNPHRKLCYLISDRTVATVDSQGIVKGIRKGSCSLYIYACNGIYTKVNVLVK